MAHSRRIATSLSLAAVLAMSASPIAAASLPAAPPAATIVMPGAFEADSENVQRHRYYRYRHHRHGVDAGDVIAGVLILGGIAAIASAASRNDRDRRYREEEYRSPEYNYRERRGDLRYDGTRGIDRAVDMCVSRIERDIRVDNVDLVERTGEGWRVTGSLYNGEGFSCSIGADGRIEGVDYGGRAADFNGQLSDERYRSAWAQFEGENSAEAGQVEARPAYPGGPLPEEEADDGRYSAAD